MRNNAKKILTGRFKIWLCVLCFGISNYAIAQYDPKPVFKGTIGKTLADTKQWNDTTVKAPQGAPNVVWILIDAIIRIGAVVVRTIVIRIRTVVVRIVVVAIVVVVVAIHEGVRVGDVSVVVVDHSRVVPAASP